MKILNTLNTATIIWESVGKNVSYTVSSSNSEAPSAGITQTSYTLHDLEVETYYVVSVTATNECGIESPPSEEITVRIDIQGIVYMCKYAIDLSTFHRVLTVYLEVKLVWCVGI